MIKAEGLTMRYGPVLALDGSLVAVTVGVMVDFDGSNLGVPVAEVHRLLAEADSP